MPHPHRSALFLPASNPRAIAKARTLPCDVVILDLEDAVAPDAKTQAREAALEAAAQGFGERRLVIRANALDTSWGEADCAALRDAPVDAVLLPKVDGPADARRARALLGEEGPPLWAMIETCRGVLALADLCAAAPAVRLEGLIAGTNDLAKQMRLPADPARTALMPLLVQMVVAARAYGLIVLDGVCNALDDADRLGAECAQGRMLGFDGKTLIHPSQIAPANTAFGPSPDEIAWARAVVAAFADPANAALGAIRLDGQMVERLHLAQAERLLALA
ncbi:CoA ester lyase [Sphingomonas sp. NY01]|uniref:HpcH/HpaI aldolase/citrate lyase family protein n=1 Tax=Sphingomonas sp. NY01 TaxID=2968057 RepID=UPI00315CDFE7